MRVLLFGASGHVGSALHPLLAARYDLVAPARADADFAVAGAAAAVVTASRPDVIVNAAAWTAVDAAESQQEAAHRINADTVAEIAREAGNALLVHYSTDYVFDGSGTRPWTEADEPTPINAYGQGKHAGERAVVTLAQKHLVFRTSWVHAPGQHNFITTILRLARERDSLRVVADQFGAPTSARQIAEVTMAALDRHARGRGLAHGLYHLAAAGETSWHGCATHVVEAARGLGMDLRLKPQDILPIASVDYPQPARRPANSRLDTAKLEAALSMRLPDWRLGASETVAASLGSTVS